MTVGARPAADDTAELNAALRLTTGVTVLTAGLGCRMHGSTASSVGLLTRTPPTIGVGLRQGSALAGLASEEGWFAVNVLSGRQALVADWFANPERPRGRAQFDLVDWEPDRDTALPLLRGALAHLVCRVAGSVPVGDHTLLLGTVVSGRYGPGTPLINHAGALHGAEFRDVARRRRWRALAATATALD